jgi:hypothetical protein
MKLSKKTNDFLFRVGGFFGLVLCAILLAKRFYPGYEAVASMFVCFVVVIAAAFEHIKKQRVAKRKAKGR